MKHKHHIIPRHAGGTNDPSNLILLTITEHAEAHRLLYEEHNRWQDRVAWQTLSGQISLAEAIKQAQSLSNKGRIITQEHRDKISKSLTGRKFGKRKPGTGKKISEALLGIKHTEERKQNMKNNHADVSGKNNPMYGKSATKGKIYKKELCPHCNKLIAINVIKSLHLNNCKLYIPDA